MTKCSLYNYLITGKMKETLLVSYPSLKFKGISKMIIQMEIQLAEPYLKDMRIILLWLK
jgi:hypothetical protein